VRVLIVSVGGRANRGCQVCLLLTVLQESMDSQVTRESQDARVSLVDRYQDPQVPLVCPARTGGPRPRVIKVSRVHQALPETAQKVVEVYRVLLGTRVTGVTPG